MAELWDVLPEARAVGGAVRDMLAGRAVADVDFAVPLTPETVIARAEAAGFKPVPTGLAHGTVTVVVAGQGFEVTSLRRDIAANGRHAVVAFTKDWREDANRRDFTINAMYASRSGEIWDYFGGRRDLAEGRVRFVGDAERRITEDYLRILRFFRFFARYGGGEPDAGAVAAIRALRGNIVGLSAERVWSELKAILSVAEPGRAVALMRETGVLEVLLPGADMARFEALLRHGAPADPILRLAALRGGAGGELRGWKPSTAERNRLQALLGVSALTPAADDAALRRALAAEPAELLTGRTWLAQDEKPGWDSLRARLSGMARPVFPLRGRDLEKLGVPEGRQIGEMLKAIREWWLAGGCTADAARCRERLAAMLRNTPGEG